MSADDAAAALFESGLLVETEAGVELSASFRSLAAAEERAARERGPERALADADQPPPAAIREPLANAPNLLGRYVALASELPDASPERRLQLLAVVDGFFPPAPPDDGAPAAFLAVHGSRLPFLLSLYRRAVVYVWREDCPPCEGMREALEEAFPEPPSDLALLAVFGPDDPELLADEYGVTAGPTTLFAVGGAVDARLVGSHYADVVRQEVEALRNSSAPARG